MSLYQCMMYHNDNNWYALYMPHCEGESTTSVALVVLVVVAVVHVGWLLLT